MVLPHLLAENIKVVKNFHRRNRVIGYFKPEATTPYSLAQAEVVLEKGKVYDLNSLNLVAELTRTAGTVCPANLDCAFIKSLKIMIGTKLVSSITDYNQLAQTWRNYTYAECKRRTNSVSKFSDGTRTIAGADIPLAMVLDEVIPMQSLASGILDLELIGEDVRILFEFADWRIFGGMNSASASFQFINMYATIDEIEFKGGEYRQMVSSILASGGHIDFHLTGIFGTRQYVDSLNQSTDLYITGKSVDFVIATAVAGDYNTASTTPSTTYAQDLTSYFRKIGSVIESAQLFINNQPLQYQPIRYYHIPAYNNSQLGKRAGNVILTEQDVYDKWAFFCRLNMDDHTMSGVDMQSGPIRFQTRQGAGLTSAAMVFVWVFKTQLLQVSSAGITIQE